MALAEPSGSSASPKPAYRVLAFAGGGFDTAMQLGVAHAFLVSGAEAPQCVIGTSAGALNGAALLEILQTGAGLPEPERRIAQVARLREFLIRYPELPREMLDSIFPDGFEVNERAPLEPVKLPIHFEAERKVRDLANRAREGLVKALNQCLKIRLPVSFFTILTRRLLGISEAAEHPGAPGRFFRYCRHLLGIWRLGWRHFHQLAPVLWGMLWAWFRGDSSWQERARRRQRARASGKSAGSIILESKAITGAARAIRRTFGVLFFPLLWIVGPLVLLALRFAKTPLQEMLLRFVGRVLAYYELEDGLASPDVLKQVLVQLIDPNYYGHPHIQNILAKALGRDSAAMVGDPTAARTIGDYAKHPDTPVSLAVVAADVATGKLTVMPDEVKVVDALLAATAVTPIFPAVQIKAQFGNGSEGLKAAPSEKWFIDGVNVSNDVVAPLMDYLRPKDLSAYGEVQVFPVTPLPLAAGKLPNLTGKPYSGLLDVVSRAMTLKQFRDARLQKRTTNAYSAALPGDSATCVINGQRYVRAYVHPIEPPHAVEVHRRLLEASDADTRRNIILETIAIGCRSALETMLTDAIREDAGENRFVPCRTLLQKRRTTDGLPGSNPNGGPGLNEICRQCAAMAEEKVEKKPASVSHEQVLIARKWDAPEWPARGQRVHLPNRNRRVPKEYRSPGRWPRDVEIVNNVPTGPGTQRPTVSLLFSGGVFRGVFYMGVANALAEVGCVPDIVAGASVGSITAAMVAQMFLMPAQERAAKVMDLVSTFLAIDRLILTDRFADFVRLLTVRAAEADFSPADLDRVFRRYDADGALRFSRRMRRVMAGLERLLYVCPFELRAFVEAQRMQDHSKTSKLLRLYMQELLVRGGVGEEVLGSEPLELLIRHHVLQPLMNLTPPNRSADRFSTFSENGIHFLATVTNLTSGELQILGTPGDGACLMEGLLASGAFPGVFRPRWSFEVLASPAIVDQYIDGGVMDNLPFDAVTRFLDRASEAKFIARRPVHDGKPVPHLIFTASLETDLEQLNDNQTGVVAGNWLRLMNRARQLEYNRKVDLYTQVQNDLRAIDAAAGDSPDRWRPVDVHVLAVKPKWLCSTFAFHPMLGFRRRKQAANIAHGCASTFAAMYGSAEANPEWAKGWQMYDRVRNVRPEAVRNGLYPQVPEHRGGCWFRRDVPCPFSENKLRSEGITDPVKVQELSRIYELCGRAETHRGS